MGALNSILDLLSEVLTSATAGASGGSSRRDPGTADMEAVAPALLSVGGGMAAAPWRAGAGSAGPAGHAWAVEHRLEVRAWYFRPYKQLPSQYLAPLPVRVPVHKLEP